MLPWILAAVVVAALAKLRRTSALAAADRRYAERHPRGPDGIAAGAESFTLPAGTGRALLLLHGSGDSPQTLRYLAGRLQAAGYTVHAPLLPGHGRSPTVFAEVEAGRYFEAAEAGLDVLRRDAAWIGVVGLSMGGAIAARLAATSSDVRALVLLAPYLEPPRSVRWAARTSRLWGAVAPYVDGRGEGSVQDVTARGESRAYGLFTPAALRALVETSSDGQRALPLVTAPTLVVHSREDIRIPTAIAERASASLRAPTERRWVSGCGHVITVDYCKATVADLVIAFLAPLAVPLSR